MPGSFSVHLDAASPAAIDVSRDADKVVVAGRNVFKIFGIHDDDATANANRSTPAEEGQQQQQQQGGFVERHNLRTVGAGKNLNLNYSCSDVAWSPHDDGVIVSAATNGAVCLWNLGRAARSKLEKVYTDHKRTVQRVQRKMASISLSSV